MRFVIQRVNHANVKIDGEVVGNIGHGLLILFGAGQDDTEEMLPKYVDKICKMRIFEDENGKTNLSLADVSGELLIVSQFTLYADCRKGNRPSFVHAGSPDAANELRLIWLTPFMKNSSQCAVSVSLKLKPADSVLI